MSAPRGPWMLGASGEVIHLTRPSRTPIHLSTIIRALGHTLRFGGHTARPYSVLEHSVLVAQIAYANEVRGGYTPRADRVRALAAIHDAHEAYTGDTPSPVKQVLGLEWRLFERAWESRIADTLAAGYSDVEPVAVRDAVKRADLIALLAERIALLPAGGPAWAVRDELAPEDRAEAEALAPSLRFPLAPRDALAVEFRRYLAAGGMLGDGSGVWPAEVGS